MLMRHLEPEQGKYSPTQFYLRSTVAGEVQEDRLGESRLKYAEVGEGLVLIVTHRRQYGFCSH